MCENLNEIASDFIQVLCTQVKAVCGEPLKVGQLYSEPISLKFSSASAKTTDVSNIFKFKSYIKKNWQQKIIISYLYSHLKVSKN